MNYPLAGLALLFVIITIIITYSTLTLNSMKQYYYKSAEYYYREQLPLVEKNKYELEKKNTNWKKKI